jgi:hypothetical protein
VVTAKQDLELEQLNQLLHDYHPYSKSWNIIFARIDKILDERGKMEAEVITSDDNTSI